MTCVHTQERLLHYLHGEMEDAEAVMMRQHLQRCSACAATAEDLQALRLKIEQALNPCGTPPPSFNDRALTYVYRNSLNTWRIPVGRFLPLGTALLAAIIVLALLSIHLYQTIAGNGVNKAGGNAAPVSLTQASSGGNAVGKSCPKGTHRR